ncbi:zinc finger MYM-type protein 1-like [Labrus bergylta]|uniref:zinc finger MYM-type protein 1-like n=1 Tax=Labrus bergylta TaxID=56723 RepID=UPI0033136DE8
MSGSTGGVQAHFRRLHPEAIYVHCYAHELNLVLCHTCKAIPEAATIQVALTVPVSSCSCERSFSALRRLHSWLRQTMGQKRLHSLAVMSIEKDTLQHTSHNRVIDRFATLKNRWHSLMLPPTK